MRSEFGRPLAGDYSYGLRIVRKGVVIFDNSSDWNWVFGNIYCTVSADQLTVEEADYDRHYETPWDVYESRTWELKEVTSNYDTITPEITPEIVGLYGTLVSTFTNIFFAALVPGTTSVPGEGGGSVEISGSDWTLNEYSPDGELIANGALSVGLDQTPIPLTQLLFLNP